MPKQNKKSFFDRKIFCAIFAVLVSITLWVYIEYSQNPDMTQTVSNIPVEVTGQDKLAADGLVMTELSRNAVSIKFTGKRNVLAQLNSNKLSVTVNLEDILNSSSHTTGSYQLDYTINYPTGVNDNRVNAVDSISSYITVNVDNLISADVVVTGSYENLKVADGYQAEPMQFDKDHITVSGPEAKVSKIALAVVEVQRENVSATISEDMEYILKDSDGNDISKELLTFSQDRVHVTIPISMIKEVPLTVNFIEGNSADINNITYKITPQTVTLSGSAEELEDINNITLGTIDLTSFALSTTEEFPIVLPNNMDNLSGETTAKVKVEVTERDTSEVTVTSITTKNEPVNMNIDVITQSVDVMLRGKEKDLSRISAENIRIVADLGEIGNNPGTYSVIAKVTVDGFSEVDAVGTYKVTVTIT